MIVILNNGTRIRIDKADAQVIAQKLMSKEATQWQCILNTQTSEIVSILNLKDISAIVAEDAITDDVIQSSKF